MTSPTVPEGALPLDLPPLLRVGPARAPGADLHVRVLAGAVDRLRDDRATTYRPGDLLTCRQGATWTLVTGSEGARLLVWSSPPGLEQVLAAVAADPGLDRATLVAVATDNGVLLQPEPLPGSRNSDVGPPR